MHIANTEHLFWKPNIPFNILFHNGSLMRARNNKNKLILKCTEHHKKSLLKFDRICFLMDKEMTSLIMHEKESKLQTIESSCFDWQMHECFFILPRRGEGGVGGKANWGSFYQCQNSQMKNWEEYKLANLAFPLVRKTSCYILWQTNASRKKGEGRAYFFITGPLLKK